MVAAGLEHPPLEQSKTAISTGGGAKSGAPDAPKSPKQPEIDTPELPSDLVEIVAVWPEVPSHIKAAIKALVQTHSSKEAKP